MVNKSTNTDKITFREIISGRSPSLRLKERNVKHSKISNIRELNDLYIYGQKLGSGVFGTVVEITDKSTKQIWALKIVDRKNTTRGTKFNTIENELKILRMVNHPHIIYLERTFESNTHIYLVIERCTTELASILRRKEIFSENEARKVLEHLSSAVAYLHKHDIVHRDLKMENILTAPNPDDPEDELYIKVSDFGLGIIKSGNRLDEMLTERCGTLVYMAPEIISRSSYSHQCDVWAMGVIYYLLLTGNFPFYNQNESDLFLLICNYDPCSETVLHVTSEVRNILKKMLEKNPALRISAAEVNRHPYVQHKNANIKSHNVLDMMQQWRDEMLLSPENNKSDWAAAFSNLDAKTPTKGKTKHEDKKQIVPKNFTKSVAAQADEEKKEKRVNEFNGMKPPPYDSPHNRKQRALNVSGKSTKLMRIGHQNPDKKDKQN